MNRVKRLHKQSAESDLERVIEPLASYIFATEQPKAALMTALAVLFNEVDQHLLGSHGTNRNHFREPLIMKYLLLIYSAEQELTDEVRGPCYEESTRLAQILIPAESSFPPIRCIPRARPPASGSATANRL